MWGSLPILPALVAPRRQAFNLEKSSETDDNELDPAG
jgi:hypothetical protein